MFHCEKDWQLCFVVGAHVRFRHFTNCATDTVGRPAAGCIQQDAAYCYRGPDEFFCYPTMSQCEDTVSGVAWAEVDGVRHKGKMVLSEDMKPLSKCAERRPDEF
jgi:hypothetical protein